MAAAILLTRAETAAVLYRLATGDVTDAQEHIYAKYGNFPDVAEDAWYAGYVGYCANQELILGRPDGTFDPKGNVTGYEVLAMILRAVGYGTQPGEFTGSNWAVTVAYRAQTLGILDNINTTRYGGATLYEPARRDVVAELLFQTVAYVPTVNWTTAFGYQDTGDVGGVVGSVKNDTLGYKVFGLTYNTGVIVGNEMTGEPAGTTKIGFSLDSQPTNGVIGIGQSNDTVVTGYNAGNVVTFYTRIDDSMAIRGQDKRSAYIYESDTANSLPENVTRTFQWTSDLRQFNHAVKVWYNNRSNQYVTVGTLRDADGNTLRDGATGRFSTNLQTYAVIDKVVNTAVVSLWDWDAEEADSPLEATLGTVAAPGPLADAARNDKAERNNNWSAPNFKLRTNYGTASDTTTNLASEYAAYFNYSFGPMFADSASNTASGDPLTMPTLQDDSSYGSGVVDVTSGSEVARVADSVVQRNNEESLYRLYLLISNTEGSVLDVVIPLDMTFSRVAQTNNTTNAKSVSILAGNEDINDGVRVDNPYAYFGVTADRFTSSDFVGDVLAEMAQKNTFTDPLYPADASGILSSPGTTVAAIEVTGTAPGNVDDGTDYNWDGDGILKLWDGESNDVDNETIGNAEAAGGYRDLESTYYYHLTRNHYTVTAKVVAINPNDQTLTLTDASDGRTTLRQSVFAEATDANFTRKIEGVDKDSKDFGGEYNTYLKVLEEGKTYTFTLDAEGGNYIWWTDKNPSVEFVYGTYVDFTSPLASSTFTYPLVYVDQEGNEKQWIETGIKSIYDFHAVSNAGSCIDGDGNEHVNADDTAGVDNVTNWHSGNNDLDPHEYYVGGSMSGAIYNDLVLPKGDTGASAENGQLSDAGFRKGFYVGYAYDKSTGRLEAVGPFDLADPETEKNDSRYTGFYQATGSDFGAAKITITDDDVAVRSKQINNRDYHVDYFLTNETKFVIVDGAGRDNQSAEVLVGIDALRKGAKEVYIDLTNTGDLYTKGSTWLLDADDSHKGLNAWEMVYFKFTLDSYAQDYLNSAYRIDTIFIPKAAISRSTTAGTQSLWFVGNNTQTNIASVEGGIYTQFLMYDAEGNPEYKWIDGWINDSSGDSSAYVVGHETMRDTFYKLLPTGATAPDGKPVYEIREVTSSDGVIGYGFTGWDNENDPEFAPERSPFNLGNDDIVADSGYAEYQPTTLAQSAWIDEPNTFDDGNTGTDNRVTATMYYVGGAKVVNLNVEKYPGITELLATLHNAGSTIDNERIRVSCVMSGTRNVVTIFVNYVQA